MRDLKEAFFQTGLDVKIYIPGPCVKLAMRLLILIALALLLHPLIIAQTLIQQSFYMIPDHALVGSVIGTYQVRDEFACCHKCVHNTRCLSFNYGITTNTNLSICEISSSEQTLDRQTLQRRFNFKYHGTFGPCWSDPCVNGGRCTESKDSFTCNCPLSIRDLPYTDGRCNVDNSLISTTGSYAGVFEAAVGRYKLTFYEAQRLCEILDATLASYDQLYKAWEAGMERCAWGWMKDATARFPMQQPRSGCSSKVGIMTEHPSSKYDRYNAMCYKP